MPSLTGRLSPKPLVCLGQLPAAKAPPAEHAGHMKALKIILQLEVVLRWMHEGAALLLNVPHLGKGLLLPSVCRPHPAPMLGSSPSLESLPAAAHRAGRESQSQCQDLLAEPPSVVVCPSRHLHMAKFVTLASVVDSPVIHVPPHHLPGRLLKYACLFTAHWTSRAKVESAIDVT